jgi:nucleoside-diphosphate-sugar epimerase
MAAREAHLVTGATGFIGGAVVLELLARTDADVFCLTRPKGNRSPADRLHAALARAARAYGRPDLLAAAPGRCRAIPGDITEPYCGLDPNTRTAITQIWHAAGSLAFQEHRQREISLHNVKGTENVIGLAAKLSVPCLNHFSTAYVAGRRGGAISAEPVTDEDMANNGYERSKIIAENSVLNAAIERIRVFRPSIVIGHSRTFAATSFTGLYGFITGLLQVRSAVRPILGDYLAFRPLRLLGSPDAVINFVPIDDVSRTAVTLGLQAGTAGIYHLANSWQPVLGESMTVLAERLDMMPPQFVNDSSEFSLIDERVNRRLAFYQPYLHESRYFDLARTREACGSRVLEFPLPADRLRDYIDWYMEYRQRKVDIGNRHD